MSSMRVLLALPPAEDEEERAMDASRVNYMLRLQPGEYFVLRQVQERCRVAGRAVTLRSLIREALAAYYGAEEER